jgi:hypothetical protein
LRPQASISAGTVAAGVQISASSGVAVDLVERAPHAQTEELATGRMHRVNGARVATLQQRPHDVMTALRRIARCAYDRNTGRAQHDVERMAPCRRQCRRIIRR